MKPATGLLVLLSLLLPLTTSGCCNGPGLGVEAFDPRLELHERTTFALVCPVLDDPRAWAYADPPKAVRPFGASYRAEETKRPAGVAAPFPDPRQLRPAADAPPDLQTLLRTARSELKTLGYRPATTDADIVVSLAVTRRDGGALDRVSVQVGAVVAGRFEPALLRIAATVPDDDPCPVELAALLAELLRALPPRGAAP